MTGKDNGKSRSTSGMTKKQRQQRSGPGCLLNDEGEVDGAGEAGAGGGDGDGVGSGGCCCLAELRGTGVAGAGDSSAGSAA